MRRRTGSANHVSMTESSGRSGVRRRATASLLEEGWVGMAWLMGERLRRGEGEGGGYLQPSVRVRRADHACHGLLASQPPAPRGAVAKAAVTVGDQTRGTWTQTCEGGGCGDVGRLNATARRRKKRMERRGGNDGSCVPPWDQ